MVRGMGVDGDEDDDGLVGDNAAPQSEALLQRLVSAQL